MTTWHLQYRSCVYIHPCPGFVPESTSIVDEYMRNGGHVPLPCAESPTFRDAVRLLGPLQVGVTPEGMAVCRDDDGQRLAESFAPWYYRMLQQAASPAHQGIAPDAQSLWGAHHFWPDAKLQIFELPDGNEFRATTADAVSAKLAGLIADGYIFEPTLSADGIKGMMTVNHIISVSVGGSFSQLTDDDTLCEGGTFEQSFTLIQDRASTNWRIKTTDLKLMWLVSRASQGPDDEPNAFPFLATIPKADLPTGLPIGMPTHQATFGQS